MIKKIYVFFLLLILLLLFITAPGCWNRQEPEDLALVTAMGLDRDEDGHFKVVVLIANPKAMAGSGENDGGGGEAKAELAAAATGRTIFEAFRNLDNKFSRRLNVTHMSVIIISEDFAREGLLPLIDVFDRERQSRLQAVVLVVDGDVRKAMEAELPLEENWFSGILLQTQNVFGVTGTAIEESFRTIIQRLAQPGWELKLSRLQVLETEESLVEESPVLVNGTAAFKGDRMVGWCNDQETRGFLWLENNVERVFYVLDSPSPEGGQLSVEIFQANSRMEARVDGDQVFITVEVMTDGRLHESTGTEEWLTQESELVHSLDRRLAQAVRNDIFAAVRKCQEEFNSDNLGFGNLIYRTLPRDWERLEGRWDEIFPEIKVEVLVDANVRRTGLVKDTVRIRKN